MYKPGHQCGNKSLWQTETACAVDSSGNEGFDDETLEV